MDVVVKAYKSSQKAHDAGIFATVEIYLKEGTETRFRLCDAQLRKSNDGKGWWVAFPSRAVKTNETTKYYRYWWIYPEDQDKRREAEAWIVEEVIKQIGDPNIPGEREPKQATPAPAKNATPNRAPFAPGGSSGGTTKPTGRVSSPFSPSSVVPGGDDFALGGPTK